MAGAGAFNNWTLNVVVPEANAAHPPPPPAVTVKVSTTGVELARPPADTVSQPGSAGLVPMVKGVPLVAAEVTLTVCAALAVVVVLLQVKVTELGEGTSALPLLVVMFTVTGTTRAVPVAGVNVIDNVPAGTVPLQPGAIVKLKFVATVVELTVAAAGITTGPEEADDSPAEPDGVTLIAEPDAASVMPTDTAVGPASVSQFSVSEVGFATNVAVACSVPVQMTSARIARSTFRERI
ncbi:MAG: hypothetical protein ABSH00_06705 [Bryobacteraceae bacterium]